MPNLKQFKLPDLGEGLTEGEILRWLVKPGDAVTLNQPIVEVETAKAAVELPSPYAGTVTELLHGEGDTVDVGTPIITFDTAAGGASPTDTTAAEVVAAGAAANPAETSREAVEATAATTQTPGIPASLVENPPDDAGVEPGIIGGPAPGGRTSVLVGYGPRSSVARRRPRTTPGAPAPGANSAPSSTAPPTPKPPARVSAAEVGAAAARSAGGVTVLAKPPVRKLARDLGVDLASLTGTGPHGTISRADVEAAAGAEPEQPTAPAYDFDARSREQRIPVKGVRKMTAQAMVASAFTAPHVTEFVTVDVTRTTEFVARLRRMREFDDIRVSPLLVAAKALMIAIRRHPMVNSSWDEDSGEIVVKGYVNLGIAAATPRGLVVPNIKDADQLSLVDLGRALNGLADTARAGRTAPAEMQHGTITITNVGVFGMDTGTPILNPPEAAILALGAIRPMPWVVDGSLAVRDVTTLALSFDHRIIDGELGSRFLADVAAVLENPDLLAAWS